MVDPVFVPAAQRQPTMSVGRRRRNIGIGLQKETFCCNTGNIGGTVGAFKIPYLLNRRPRTIDPRPYVEKKPLNLNEWRILTGSSLYQAYNLQLESPYICVGTILNICFKQNFVQTRAHLIL